MAHQGDNFAIFAHYDKHNIVDEYVLIYLHNLKKFCDKIIFVSDGDLSVGEQQKILPFVSDIIAKKHQEYDFGSWKRGFNLLKEKYPEEFANADKLIFANDSCYCIGEFDFVFSQIDQMPEIDGFGITDSGEIIHHLQSYFLVLRPTVFRESFFDNFLQNVTKQQDKRKVIASYEIDFSKLLANNNKKIYAVFGKEFIQNYAKQNQKIIQTKIRKIIGFYQKLFGLRKIFRTLFMVSDCYSYRNGFYLLILSGCPLLKRLVIRRDFSEKKFFNSSSLFYFWKNIIDNETVFNSEIILNHANRILK